MSGFIKILPVGAELLLADIRTDRQTDMTKLIVAFRNFAKAPKNCPLLVNTTIELKTITTTNNNNNKQNTIKICTLKALSKCYNGVLTVVHFLLISQTHCLFYPELFNFLNVNRKYPFHTGRTSFLT